MPKKWLHHFFGENSLRSVPQMSAFSRHFDTHSAQSIFSDVHAAVENDFIFFRRFGAETLRGFDYEKELHPRVEFFFVIRALRRYG